MNQTFEADHKTTQDLSIRTKKYALDIIKLYASLSKSVDAQVLGKQVLRSGTSVGAQYREAYHSKSDADFISKMEGALQELNESIYWLELLEETGISRDKYIKTLQKETKELIAIFITIVKKVKARSRTS